MLRVRTPIRALAVMSLAATMSGTAWAAARLVVDGPLDNQGYKPRYARLSHKTASLSTLAARAAATPLRVSTVPYWSSSFTVNGTDYPFSMVGKFPGKGTSSIANVIVPVAFYFLSDGTYLDPTATPFTLTGPATALANTLKSPNWNTALYSAVSTSVGKVQFGDAVQRATFWNVPHASTWHVNLGKPAVRKPIIIYVPPDQGQAQHITNGPDVGLVSIDFIDSQIQTLLQLEGVKAQQLVTVLAYNVFAYQGTPANCCVLGYHSADFFGPDARNVLTIQTYEYASWSDGGIFSEPNIADIHALSHEISEWMNDPFVDNMVPPWSVASAPQYGCSAFLETGDPIVGSSIPVTVNAYEYHPQSEALLQWFARQDPSSAVDGVYSFPDANALTVLPVDCVP